MSLDRPARPEPWHRMPVENVLAALGTSARGLVASEARRRLAAHGPNLLPGGSRRTALDLVAGQFSDVMILVLLAAAVVAGVIGELLDAAAILAILLLNAVVGVVQEYRAERALQALRTLAAPTAVALRDGHPTVMPAAELVPGDVVRLEAGALIPADLRLLEAPRLRVDESPLTGESVPAEKLIAALDAEDLALADRVNMAYKGTLVTYGRGQGAVVATGTATELGRIASLLEQAERVQTPLQRRLAQLGRRLAAAALFVCGAVFAVGVARGEPLLLMFLTAVSLAVAAIPEALPAVVTIALALGARKMVAQRALVRRLSAVETLGSVTYVCADKTGTLTLNRMRVEEVWRARAATEPGPVAPEEGPDLLRLAMALCNDAEVTTAGGVQGDPTEAALAAAALEDGADKRALEAAWPRLAEVPFDAERKRMTTVHQEPGGRQVSFTKGAVETVLPRCAGGATTTAEALAEAERMAGSGLRVLALAARRWRDTRSADAEELESGLTLLGLVGLVDPPRPEAEQAVRTCQAAGMVPVMITGDHPLTARAIARRLGILVEGGEILTGPELSALPAADLVEGARRVRVYARVAPEQKLRIVEALQARGEVVAMTGDGVNDAPALKRADIGVAMGLAGTDAARAASAMVLLDDNFTTIVTAVREGRRVYDNIRRFVRYAVATNSAEVLTLFAAPLLGLPVPLLPLQILWINLVTDSLPGLALAAEPGEDDIMRRPPRPPGESLFARGLAVHVIWVGLLMAGLAVAAEAWFVGRGDPAWQTVVFTVLCLSQLGHALAIRSERRSLFGQGLLSNVPLLGAVALTVALQAAIVYVPALRTVFRTEPLDAFAAVAALGLSTVVFLAVELEKWVLRRRERAPRRARLSPASGRTAPSRVLRARRAPRPSCSARSASPPTPARPPAGRGNASPAPGAAATPGCRPAPPLP